MVISHSHKFIFIHIYKAAGTSIAKALDPFAYNPNRWLAVRLLRRLGLQQRIKHYKLATFPAHTAAIELRESLPHDIFTSYFKFAFVRNPWDWQVSLYSFMLQSKRHRQHELAKSFKCFEEYLEWRVSEDRRLQKDFVVDTSGNVIVDFIGKFEDLQNDFKLICDRISLTAELPHVNKTKHDKYESYYTPYTKKLVEEAFKEDIELFRYDF